MVKGSIFGDDALFEKHLCTPDTIPLSAVQEDGTIDPALIPGIRKEVTIVRVILAHTAWKTDNHRTGVDD
jgi:hypothetical protein